MPSGGNPSGWNLNGVDGGVVGAGLGDLAGRTQEAITAMLQDRVSNNSTLKGFSDIIFEGLELIKLPLAIIEAIVTRLFGLIPGFGSTEEVLAVIKQIPIIGDLVELLTGVEDGDLTDLGTFFLHFRNFFAGINFLTGDFGDFTDGFTTLIENIWGWLEAVVDNLLEAIGLSPVGSLLDRIFDLADGIGDWLLGTEGVAADLSDLMQDLLTNPAAVLGNISQSMVSGLSSALSGLTSGIGGIINGIVNGWNQGTTTGADPDVYQTIETIRLMVSGEWTIETLTSSGTWTKPTGTISDFWAIGVGGGGRGVAGQSSNSGAATCLGGPGGVDGSYVAIQIDPAELGSTVPYTVGAAASTPGGLGGATTFGSFLSTTPGGAGGIASAQGYMLTTSRPGSGGKGGDAIRTGTGGGDHSATAGEAGGSSALGSAGSAGSASVGIGSGTGGAGGTGGNASTTGLSKSGGGGGGGGGGAARSGGGSTANGGAGGNGGYPGGASGGGGAATNQGIAASANGGSPGVPANGILFLMYKAA